MIEKGSKNWFCIETLHRKKKNGLTALPKLVWYIYHISVSGNTGRVIYIYTTLVGHGLQKRAIRIIIGARNNDSCREFFKILKILPLSIQYIYSLLLFVANNINLFLDNAELYTIKTRNSYNLHAPLSHLTKYQNGVH